MMKLTMLLLAAAANAGGQDAGTARYRAIFPSAAPAWALDPLKAEEGVWDADVELHVGKPGAPPIRKAGVQTNRRVSGGHAMLNEFRYSDGSYAGTGLWGWDADRRRYTGSWIDSETQLVRHDSGWYDPGSRTMRWDADTLQPDGATTRMRIVQQFEGDRRTFQIDVMDAATGAWRKLIVMTFRKRSAATG